MKKSQHQRSALIDRLERKYSQKVQLHKLHKQQSKLKRSLRLISGQPLADTDLDYELSGPIFHHGRRIAF